MPIKRPHQQLSRGALFAALLLAALPLGAQQALPSGAAPKQPAALKPAALKPAALKPAALKPAAPPAPPSASVAPVDAGEPESDAASDAGGDAAPPASAEIPAPPVPSASAPLAEPAPPTPEPLAEAPAPASSAAIERSEPAGVRIGDTVVFSLYAPHGQKPPDERARLASKALAGVLETAREEDVRVNRQGDTIVVFVRQAPIVQLGEQDALLAGDSTLDVHAANVAAALRRGIATEAKRRAVAKTVFSISLVVFFALIAFYLMRKVGEFAEKARVWLDQHGEKSLRVRVRDIEVLSPATAQSAALIGLSLGKWLGQFGIFYSWLVVVLSLFEATRGYTQRLTGFVVQPLSEMMGRLATTLPLLVVALIAGLAVFVLVRFAGLFFRSIERRETTVPWLPAELAHPTSVIVRVVIILGAVIIAGPVVTGDDSGALARLGMVALAALGFSSVPLLANALVGVYIVFARRLRLGQHVEIGGRTGRVAGLDLMEVRLEDAAFSELRFPHLMLLRQPTRVFGVRPRVFVEFSVAPEASPEKVRELLEAAALKVGRDARVELVSADSLGITFRISVSPDSFAQRSDLQLALLDALRSENVKLGRARGSLGEA